MITVNIPYFAPIAINCLDEEYPGELELRGEQVRLDLNFERDWIAAQKLEPVRKMVGRLVSMDQKSMVCLHKDYMDKDSTIVRYYLQYLLENVWRPTLQKRVDFLSPTISPMDQLFQLFRLERVGFYPEKEEWMAVFDYFIDARYSESVIAMHYSHEGKLIEILMHN
ncbi:DUF2004 domain-containing protein [Paraflavitalea speifideaquila]|uniref:DUF2004 domain-containing protein n=1 Tax=Paraflavitalea speifideaquila TaxID=3076558 RepID=UPI0028F08FDE|nr:DUF2004 domain-containing protein [Paraflavitalea speifideiaquila]